MVLLGVQKYMDTPVPIDFDPAKDARNREKHGVSLAEAAWFQFETALIAEVGAPIMASAGTSPSVMWAQGSM